VRFVLLDETEGATTQDGGALTPTLLAKAAALLTFYLQTIVGKYRPAARDAVVRAGSSPTDIQEGEWPFHIGATLSEPGAIAFHTVDGVGVPDLEDGLSLSASIFGPDGALMAWAHELDETIGDPATNTLRADGLGSLFADEWCDAIEVQSFPVTLDPQGCAIAVAAQGAASGLAADGSFTAYVANCLLDAFFTPNHAGPYDVMTAEGIEGANGPTGPFQTVAADGGDYQIVEPDPQQEQQVMASGKSPAHATLPKQGRVHVDGKATRRLDRKRHPGSRAYRRGLRV
jgi:hypothetical protein